MSTKQLNGGMILLARKRRKITQVELAAESGVAQAAISRLENGSRDALSLEQIQAIGRVLRFPVSFFFEQDYYHLPCSLHGAAFRKKASVPVKDQDAVVALANHYLIHLRKLLDAIDLEPQYPLLQFEIVSELNAASDHAAAVNSPAEAARKVRASWQLDDGPLLGLARYVEATGVFVLFANFEDADIDGVTLRPAGMKPVIVLNRNRPADRVRFSLAHEYAHVILHPYPYEAMEMEANEFAAELLMPESGILKDLKLRLTIPYLGKLKLKWNTAMSSLIYRAKHLGTITADEAVSIYKKMGFYGYRTTEPSDFDVPHERASLSDKLIQLHVQELGYSLEELCGVLKTEPEEFADMYGMAKPTIKIDRPKLRIVASKE